MGDTAKHKEHPVGILVADDHRGMRDLLQKVLHRQGYEVETAKDGIAALDKMATSRFAIGILDICMPGMGGVEVMLRLRENCPEVKIILITAFSTLMTPEDACRLGAVALLEKPVSLPDLRALLRRILPPPS
ncbi:MAG: response regulator [Candidatus Latescibacteria bacterium]|nr:response regulator [Candidatus Latescibacterota bacterium]